MVAQSDLPRIAELNSEYVTNQSAIRILSAKTFITAITIQSADPQNFIGEGSVNTRNVPSTDVMAAQFKVLLEQRQVIIQQQLHTMGVVLNT
jgi:hypothetical protein